MSFIVSFFLTIFVCYSLICYFKKYEEDEIKKYSRIVQVIIMWILYFFKEIFGYEQFFVSFFVLHILGLLFYKLLGKNNIISEKPKKYHGYISTNYEVLLIIINLVLSMNITFILKGDLWNSYVCEAKLISNKSFSYLVILGTIFLIYLLLQLDKNEKKLLEIINPEYGDFANNRLMLGIFIVIFTMLAIFPAILLLNNYS